MHALKEYLYFICCPFKSQKNVFLGSKCMFLEMLAIIVRCQSTNHASQKQLLIHVKACFFRNIANLGINCYLFLFWLLHSPTHSNLLVNTGMSIKAAPTEAVQHPKTVMDQTGVNASSAVMVNCVMLRLLLEQQWV